MVEELLSAAGVEKPPVDTVVLARRHLAIQVCLDRSQKQRGRAQRAGGRRQIYIRPEPTEERHQWTIAHEIGEHFKVPLLEQLGAEAQETRAMVGESLANLFAYHLLVPACWFSTDAPQHSFDILELKKLYNTASHEVIAWRLLDLPQPCIITIIDNDHVSRRRSNAWPIRRELERVEKQCQEYVNHYSRPRLVSENGWTVQGWPVHQVDWKREILRSVVDADF
jgi:Zn-dependent peptidase ImmA (M78 family)